MKVIQDGSGQKGWSTEAVCTGDGNGRGGCGARLLVDESDLYLTTNSDYLGDTDYFATFKCVQCGMETDVKSPPPSLMSRLAGKRRSEICPRVSPRQSPLSFFLAGSSKIKRNALQSAVNQTRTHAGVVAIAGAESSVNEQPVGEAEILRGAINRALSAYAIDPQGDLYFAIENGIQQQDDTQWVDYAIVLAYVPTFGVMTWVRSDAVCFPSEAVGKTQRKEEGFTKNTVGRTLQEMGLVRMHDDPHLDLASRSRQDILKDALVELLECLPSGLYPRKRDS